MFVADFLRFNYICTRCYVSEYNLWHLLCNIILWQILSSFIICVTDFMHLDYVCGRFSDLLSHVRQILCAKTLFVAHFMADFYLWNMKNVTNWISRLVFLTKIGIFFCYFVDFSTELLNLQICSLAKRFCAKFAVVFQIWKWSRSVGSGKLTQICSGRKPELWGRYLCFIVFKCWIL